MIGVSFYCLQSRIMLYMEIDPRSVFQEKTQENRKNWEMIT